jgi:hypothetical protein
VDLIFMVVCYSTLKVEVSGFLETLILLPDIHHHIPEKNYCVFIFLCDLIQPIVCVCFFWGGGGDHVRLSFLNLIAVSSVTLWS